MIKTLGLWLVVGFTFAAMGCQYAPTGEGPTVEVVKSESDNREYRYLALPNKLKVLLVSDPDTERSAAALDVHVGSGEDPADYQGLAHFLEHMLFLGTEKYPEAGEYQSFISSHGGSHNAYTSFDHTNYFFDINPDSFEPALDRFAQFFISPLFTDKYVEREKNAVHSEYTAKIKDERRKAVDVFKTLLNQQHPFSKLSVGNLETLAGGKSESRQGLLREQLLSFYDRHYSAGIMTLVLVGEESLDELESMARTKFAAVRNNEKQIVPIETPLFDKGRLPLFVQIKPGKSLRTLSVAFPTGDSIDVYRQKPLHFLGNIIGHEGKGSLLSFLKNKGWAEGLSAGQGLSYKGGATFNITVQLTEAGVSAQEQVVTSVFQAINRIRDSRDHERLFEEQKAIAEQQFRYQQKSAAVHYASSLATGMHYYETPDILLGPYVMTQYDRRLVDQYLSSMTPQNSLVTLTAMSAEVDRRTHFYQTDYSVKATPQPWLDSWSGAGINAQITLPERNQFIANNLTIVKPELDVDVPELVIDRSGLRLWFKPAGRFESPRGSLLFSMRSPVASDTAEHRARLQLLSAVISDELNELSYSATLAGLNYSVSAHMRGMSVKINGFNDKQSLLLEEILATLNAPKFDQSRFENIKREHIRKLKNNDKRQPYNLIMGMLPDLMYGQRWVDAQLLEAYQSITLEQLKQYKEAFFAGGQVDVLVYGNYQLSEARQYAGQISEVLLKQSVAPVPVAVAKLPEKSLSRQVDSVYSDASLLFYLQAADLSKERRAALGVTAQVLRADFYTSLRTEKQLGYIVSSGAYPILDVPGLFFLIQSPVADSKRLEDEIQQFLERRFEQLSVMTSEEFEQHRGAVLSRLSEAPQNLWQQTERYWQNIGQGYYQFDFRQQLISAMEGLTFEQWKAYFIEDVKENKRRLLIYTKGSFDQKGRVSGAPISSVEAFKSTTPDYHFP